VSPARRSRAKDGRRRAASSARPVFDAVAGAALAVVLDAAAVERFEGRIEKGKLDGESISFEITIEPGTIAYAGTVKGDEMTLEVTGTQGDKMALVSKRQK